MSEDTVPGREAQNDILEDISGLVGMGITAAEYADAAREAVNDILEDIRAGIEAGGGGGGGGGDGYTESEADARFVFRAGDAMSGTLLFQNGTVGAPGIAFIADANTGIRTSGADSLTLVSGGTVSFTAGSTLNISARPLSIPDGSAAVPALTFTTNSDSGLFLSGSNILGFATGGISRLLLSTTALTSSVPLVLPAGPTADLQAATKKYVDDAISIVSGGVTEAPTDGQAYLRQSAGWVTRASLGLDQASLDARYLRLAGGTLTGAITLPGAPTLTLHAATKGYVDSAISGGTAVDSTARLAAAAAQSTANDAMPKAGGTFTGMILLSGGPTLGLHPASKTYVDGLISGGTAVDSTARTSAGNRVLKAGDTMTGVLLLPDGAVGAPALAPATSSGSGIYFPAAGTVAIGSAGSNIVSITGTDVTSTKTIRGTGNASAPAFSFVGGTNTGLFLSTADLGFSVGGTARMVLGSTGLVMSVPITLSVAPTADGHAANKEYVDDAIAALSILPEAPIDGAVYGRRNAGWVGALPIIGGTLTGNLTVPTGTDTTPSLLFGSGLGASGHGGELVFIVGSLPRASIGTNGISTPYQMIGKAGAATSPSFSFTGDLNTGFYNAGPDSIGVSAGGTLRVMFNATDVTSTVPIILPGDPTADLHAATKGYVDDLVSGGVTAIDSTARAAAAAAQATADAALPLAGGTMSGIITMPTSAVTAPGINHSGSTQTGIYFPSAGVVGFAVAGSNALSVSASAITAAKQVLALGSATGTASAPAYAFTGDTDTGIYQISGDNLGFTAGGTLRLTVSTTAITSTLPVVLPGSPSSSLQAATKGYVDGLISGGTAVDSTARASAATAQTTADGKVAKGGDTMTGILTLSGAPTLTLHAATKGYVDGQITGGTAVDNTARTAAATAQTTADNAATNANGRVSKSGDTMTGLLVLSGAPTLGTHATTKTYVDGLITGGTAVDSTARASAATAQTTADGKVSKSGDTLTGTLVLPAGTTTNPSIAFTGSTNTGIRLSAGNTFAVTTSGTDRLTVSTTAISGVLPIRQAAGSVSAPSFSFTAETNTGIWQPAAGELAFAIAGTQKLHLAATVLTSAVPLLLPSDPTNNLHAATKQYVDGLVGSPVDSVARAAAAAAQADIDAHEALTNNPHSVTAAQVGALTPSDAATTYLALAGGTLTGTLSLVAGAPTLAAHATRKDYVDTQVATRLTQAAADALYQPLDAELTALAGLSSTADRLPYFTGTGTAALATFTNFGRTLVDDADASAARTTLGLGSAATQASSAFQAADAELAAIAGLVSATDRLPYFTGSGTASLATFTSFGRTLAALADAAAGRTALGLGTAAVEAATAFQSADATLTALAGLSYSARSVLELTAADTFTLRPVGTANSTDQLDRAAGDTRYLQLSGGTLTGILTLNADPVSALQAATKQYVDGRTPIVADAPNDGQEYVRKNLAWAVASSGMSDAPSDGTSYGRLNGAWTGVLPLVGGILTGALTVPAGSAGSPSIMMGDTNSGIYGGADAIGISTNGTARMTFSTTEITTTIPVVGPNGTVSAPTWSFSGDSNTGIYWVSADTMGFSTNATLRLSIGTADITSTLPIVLPGNPVNNLEVAPKQYVDTQVATRLTQTAADALYQPLDADLTAIAGLTSAADRLPYFSGSGTASLAVFTAAGRALLDDVDTAAQRTTLGLGTMATQASTSYLALAGGTMTGGLLLTSGAPTDPAHATRKDYVDAAVAAVDLSTRVAKTGDTMSGSLIFEDFVGDIPAITAVSGGNIRIGYEDFYLNVSDAEYSVLAGASTTLHWVDTVSAGFEVPVVVPAPVDPEHATNKTYVDDLVTTRVAKTGDTMTGPLVYVSAGADGDTGNLTFLNIDVDNAINVTGAGFSPIKIWGDIYTYFEVNQYGGVGMGTSAPTDTDGVNIKGTPVTLNASSPTMRLFRQAGGIASIQLGSGTARRAEIRLQGLESGAEGDGGDMQFTVVNNAGTTPTLAGQFKRSNAAFQVTDGAASAPSLSFMNDPNTGIYSAGADSIGLATNGTLRLTLSTTALTSTLPVVLPADPTTSLQAATKQYVDTEVGLKVAKTGDTMSGNLTIQKATPHLILDATGVTSGQITWKKDSVDYYKLSTSGSPLNMFWWRYDDAGANIGTIMNVTRATGEIGLGGNVQAGTAVIIRTPGLTTAEAGLTLQNAYVGADNEVDLRFQTGAGATRGRIVGQQEGATNAGRLVFSTYVGATEGAALTLAANKQATFSGSQPVVLPAGVNPTADDHAIRRAYFEAEAMARAFMRC